MLPLHIILYYTLLFYSGGGAVHELFLGVNPQAPSNLGGDPLAQVHDSLSYYYVSAD